MTCESVVGVTRFELVTSSVSGKRSPPELNARIKLLNCSEGYSTTKTTIGASAIYNFLQAFLIPYFF